MKISRVLHAGYLFEKDEDRILFDPIFENPFSVNCYAFPSVQFNVEMIQQLKISAVFISHFHDDHCSLVSLDLLNRNTPIYIYCLHKNIIQMIRELGFKNVNALELNQIVKIGKFQITVWPALDRDVDSIFQIQIDALNVLNVVDSWIDDTTLKQLIDKAIWDLVLWPFQTMREVEVLSPSRFSQAPVEIPNEWIEPIRKLNPRVIVPSSCQFILESWSWYNQSFFPISYEGFRKQMEAIVPKTKIIRFEPGESFVLSEDGLEKTKSLDWVKTLEGSIVDYNYKSETVPLLTSEIAKRLKPLKIELEKLVFEFCRLGLIQKWKNLELDEDSYFQKPRVWQLSIFNHQGQEASFFYLIEGTRIQMLTEPNQMLSWQTEIPATKIYSALHEGESLTSLYMRINGQKLDPKTESELLEVDLLEDPLLRCLYSGDVGSYQQAQLNLVLKAGAQR